MTTSTASGSSVSPKEVSAQRAPAFGGRPLSRESLASILARIFPPTAGAIPVLIALAFVGLPIALALLYTLGYTGWLNQAVSLLAAHEVTAAHGLTFAAWQQLFSQSVFLSELWTTAWVTVASTVVLLVTAWAIALYIRFARGWGRRVVGVLFVVPMFVPSVISSYALLTFWQDNGRLAGLLYPLGLHDVSLPGGTNIAVVLGLVWSNLPFSVLLIAAGLHAVPDPYIDAARDAAAPWHMIVRTILFPLAKLPTLVVITFTATGTLGTYAIPYIVGPSAPQMLGVAMTNSYTSYGQPQAAEIMAIVVFLLAAVFSVLYVRANAAEVRRLENRS
jgi:ABC-type spermidine/putrescine transport system permease subunit I